MFIATLTVLFIAIITTLLIGVVHLKNNDNVYGCLFLFTSAFGMATAFGVTAETIVAALKVTG